MCLKPTYPKTGVFRKMMEFSFVNKIRRKTKLSNDLLISSLSKDEFVALLLYVEGTKCKFVDRQINLSS